MIWYPHWGRKYLNWYMPFWCISHCGSYFPDWTWCMTGVIAEMERMSYTNPLMKLVISWRMKLCMLLSSLWMYHMPEESVQQRFVETPFGLLLDHKPCLTLGKSKMEFFYKCPAKSFIIARFFFVKIWTQYVQQSTILKLGGGWKDGRMAPSQLQVWVGGSKSEPSLKVGYNPPVPPTSGLWTKHGQLSCKKSLAMLKKFLCSLVSCTSKV